MASIYVLYSSKLDRFYIGSCKDLSYRLGQHFNKEFEKSFTAKVDDWELFLYVDDLGYEQSRLIEAHVKKMKSKTYLKNLKTYPEILEKLKTKF
jgi:putative endonuclease